MTKVGDRVRLISTSDPYTRLKPGDEGLVTYIFRQPESAGGDLVISIKWDIGSSLSLIEGVDRYEVIVQ